MQRMLWQSVIWNLIFPWIRYAQCLVYPIRIFQRYLKRNREILYYISDGLPDGCRSQAYCRNQ